MTAAEVFAKTRPLIMAMDMPAIFDLLADDCVVENPYAPTGMPARLEGKPRVVEHLNAQFERTTMRFEAVDSEVIHETTDPNTIVVEFDMLAEDTRTGAKIRRTMVQIFRVREDKIVLWRDYWNPLALSSQGSG